LSSQRVLYVEDHPSLRAAVLMSLEAAGYGTLAAGDGLEGVDLARRERPDVILMDLHLPRMSGWEALQALQNDPDTSAIPVIAVTAGELDPARARTAGFADFIPKPFQATRLISAIRTILD
jgi:CheY-like chemotaxis protein